MKNEGGISSLILFNMIDEGECFLDASEVCHWHRKDNTLTLLFKSGERQSLTFNHPEPLGKLLGALKNYFGFPENEDDR